MTGVKTGEAGAIHVVMISGKDKLREEQEQYHALSP